MPPSLQGFRASPLQHKHLAVLADDVAVVADHDGRVPDRIPVRLVPLQDRADDHHAPPGCREWE